MFEIEKNAGIAIGYYPFIPQCANLRTYDNNFDSKIRKER